MSDSVSELVNELVKELVKELVNELVSEPVSEPVSECVQPVSSPLPVSDVTAQAGPDSLEPGEIIAGWCWAQGGRIVHGKFF